MYVLKNRLHYLLNPVQLPPSPPIINNYYNVQPPPLIIPTPPIIWDSRVRNKKSLNAQLFTEKTNLKITVIYLYYHPSIF